LQHLFQVASLGYKIKEFILNWAPACWKSTWRERASHGRKAPAVCRYRQPEAAGSPPLNRLVFVPSFGPDTAKGAGYEPDWGAFGEGACRAISRGWPDFPDRPSIR